ncbi:MAG: FAD-dependent monooxygenase, partial [Betaproteobacteria bacterium]
MASRIVIVGGGPVGLAQAIAASRLRGVEVTVVERGPATPEVAPKSFDHRVYALSPASMALLDELGASLDAARIAPVRAMHVTGDDGHSGIDFNGGVPVATIAEHSAVMRALAHRLAADGRVEIKYGVAPLEMHVIDAAGAQANRRELKLSDGSVITADLLIAADGNRSQIRNWADISVQAKDYESDGVVANFKAERTHGDIARQWFTHDAVMAWLPLPDSHISIVWSLAREASSALPEEAAEFSRAVAAMGQHELGALTLVSPIARFPLSRIMAADWVQPGLALIGDAAHAVHPLAGQGVNLGFADVRNLTSILRERSKFSAIGDIALLRRYERAGREAAWAVGEVTDKLRSLYLRDWKTARWLRNEGLALMDGMPAAKAMLVDY